MLKTLYKKVFIARAVYEEVVTKGKEEKYPFVGDVRGLGLILGMEFIHKDGSPDMDIPIDIYHAAFQRGLMVNIPTTERGRHSAISIKPPIIIAAEEIDDSMERLDDAMGPVTFDTCFGWLLY